MDKIFALLGLLRKGAEISEAEKWKQHQITANVVGGFILALVAVVKAFGYELPVSDETAYTIGGGIVAVVNVVLTAITSKHAGVLPAAKPADVPTAPAVAVAVPTTAPAVVPAPVEHVNGGDPAVGTYLPG